jgi:hypothetical protein
LGYWDKKHRGWFRIALRGKYRGAVEVCTPSGAIGVGKEEHEMRMPVAIGVRQLVLQPSKRL